MVSLSSLFFHYFESKSFIKRSYLYASSTTCQFNSPHSAAPPNWDWSHSLRLSFFTPVSVSLRNSGTEYNILKHLADSCRVMQGHDTGRGIYHHPLSHPSPIPLRPVYMLLQLFYWILYNFNNNITIILMFLLYIAVQ